MIAKDSFNVMNTMLLLKLKSHTIKQGNNEYDGDIWIHLVHKGLHTDIFISPPVFRIHHIRSISVQCMESIVPTRISMCVCTRITDIINGLYCGKIFKFENVSRTVATYSLLMG